MITFQSLTLRNFLSYGNEDTTISFDEPGTTLIVGEDLDNTSHGKGGNGVGKTTLLNALVYALYDKAVSDISKDDLVNNINKKNMSVILTFIGDDGITYKIRRERAMKVGASGNNVYLYVDGEDKTPDSQAATNERIAQIIGIPYELFVRIVVFSATHTPFLNIKPDQQKEIIEELFGLTTITTKADLLKVSIKENKDRLAFKKVKIDSLVGEHDRHSQQLTNAKTRVVNWQQQNDADLATLTGFDPSIRVDYDLEIGTMQDEISEMRNIIAVKTTSLNAEAKQQSTQLRESIHDQVVALRADLKSQTEDIQAKGNVQIDLLSKAYDVLCEDIAKGTSAGIEYKAELTTLKTVKATKEAAILKYQSELKHLQDSTCPYCSQQFADTAGKIDDITIKLSTIPNDLAMCDERIAEIIDYSCESSAHVEVLMIEVDNNKGKIATIRADVKAEIKTLDDTIGLNIRSVESKIAAEIVHIEDRVIVALQTITIDINIEIRELTNIVHQLNANKLEFNTKLNKFNALTAAINPYIDALDELISAQPDVIDYTEINAITREMEHQDFLLKLLTKKDSFVRKALLNKNIPLLNSRLHQYLLALGLPHKVEFTKEMTATISQFGRTLGFGNLSAGQRARVNFALSLSFRDVLQKLHPKINVCVLDEILDTALDGIGVQLAANLIKQKAKDEELCMYVISHREELSSAFPNIMTVQMKDGFSNIKAK